jgi:hypothetical protein
MDPLTIMAGATLGSSLLGANAASSAADTQAQAGQASINAQKSMFDTTQKNIAPFVTGGQNAISALGSPEMQGYMTHQFGPQDLQAGLAPNYDFMLRQGQLAAERSGAAGGLGGNSQQSGIQYAQNYAGNAYQNAFSNFQQQRGNIFNSLYGIASLGSNAAVGQGNISAGVGQNIGNTLTGIGNAQAAGQVGTANAITGGLGQFAGMNWLANQGKGAGGYLGGGVTQPPMNPGDYGYGGP